MQDTGTADTSYTDGDVQPETHYTYRVKAINEEGESDRSTYLHVHTPAAPPAAPTGLASAASHDSVALVWTDPQDDTITGYRIERRDLSEGGDAQFVVLSNDTGNGNAAYTDNTVDPENALRVPGSGPQPPGGKRIVQRDPGHHPRRATEGRTAANRRESERLRAG